MQYYGFYKPSFDFNTLGFGDSGYQPLDLFEGGTQGVWLDPSDRSTLFQDAAGTIPVTKDGDPVGLIRDKSGNGNHATQTISAARPLYKTDGSLSWLSFDSVDDRIVIPYSMSSKTVSIIISYLKNPLPDSMIVVTINENNPWGISAEKGQNTNYTIANFRGFGHTNYVSNLRADGVASDPKSRGEVHDVMSNSNVLAVHTLCSDIWGDSHNYGNYLHGKPTSPSLTGYILIEGVNEVDNAELTTYMAKKAGVTL